MPPRSSHHRQVSGFAATVMADPWLCRRLVRLQQELEHDHALGSRTWDLRMNELRVVGRRRPSRRADTIERDHSMVVEVAFRGSKNVQNWVTNFTACLGDLPYTYCDGKGHVGFVTAYASLRHQMVEEIFASIADGARDHRPVLIDVIGHSLGGALATLAAHDLASSHGFSVRCVTFGAPRVGDAAFARSFIAAVPRIARFVNEVDVVPRVASNQHDPFDDGRIIPAFGSRTLTKAGGEVAGWASGAQRTVGVGEYFHVCEGTVLGLGHVGETISMITGAVEGKIGSGSQAFHRVFGHHIDEYAKNLSVMTDDDDEGRHTHRAAGAAEDVLSAVVGGLESLFAPRRRSRSRGRRS